MLTLASISKKRKLMDRPLFFMQANDGTGESEIEEQLGQYAQLVATVTDKCYAVSVETLNYTFYTNPEWYDDDCKNKLTGIKAHANLWIDSVKPKLFSVPQTIIDYDFLYKYYSKRIRELAQILIMDPENEEMSKAIVNNINALYGGAKDQKKLIDSTVDEIQKLLGYFQEDKAFAADIQKKSLKSKEVNEKIVSDCTDNIKVFKDEMEKYQSRIMIEEIALGVSITVCGIGIAGAVAGQPWMIFVAIAGGAGVIASMVLMIEDNKKIAKIAQKIIDEQKTLNDAEYDATNCGKLADSTMRVCDALNLALESLTQVGSLWENLAATAGELIGFIETADSDMKKKLFETLIHDMDTTDGKWNELVKMAQALNLLKIEVDSEHTLTMTVVDGAVKVA